MLRGLLTAAAGLLLATTGTTAAAGSVARERPVAARRASVAAPVVNRKRLQSSIVALERQSGASVSVAVFAGGAVATAGTPLQVRAASLIKLLIVDAALARGPLTVAEKADAAAALTRSDNDAATRLWSAAGGSAAVARVVARLHLAHTRQVAPYLEPWDGWVSTAADQVEVIHAFAVRGGLPVSLLREVESDQRWGVDAAAPAGSFPFAKDGWLPLDGAWLAHSAGCFTPRRGRLVCVAVMTAGSPSYSDGAGVATEAARAAVGAVREP